MTYDEASKADLEDLISANAALDIKIEAEERQIEEAKRK